MRDIKAVEDAKNNLRGIKNTEAIISYPPAYFQGFRLRADGTQLIVGKGCMNCLGNGVNLKTEYIVNGEDFIAPDYIIKNTTYYVYMNKDKSFKIDSREPVYDDDYFTYFHPVLYEYRYLGKALLQTDGTWAEIRNQNPVTAAGIEASAVTADEIAAGTITATEIASDAITTAKIAADAVTATEIAADAVTATEIAANAVTATEIAANAVTATKIASDAIETKVLEVGHIYIGFTSFTGSTTFAAPGEGDRVHYIDGTVDYYYEYTGGSWVTTNGIIIGGFIGTLFLAMIGCNGLYHPSNIPDSIEYLPSPLFRLFDFENDYEDHNGVDDWVTKTNTAFTTTVKKFGSYSLWANDTKEGFLVGAATGTSGESQTFAFWVYAAVTGGEGDPEDNISMNGLYDSSDKVMAYLKKEEDTNNILVEVHVAKNGSTKTTGIDPVAIDSNTWNYIGLVYDADTDKVTLVVNNEIATGAVLGGAWSGSSFAMYLKPSRNYVGGGYTRNVRIDNALYYYDKYLDPNILAQHYTHNVTWETDYSKDDILVRPNTDGRLVLETGHKMLYQGLDLCQWHQIAAPTAAWLASKTTWATADSFTAGLEVDFSSYVPAGTTMIMCVVKLLTANGIVCVRPADDDTYCKNTPIANGENFSRIQYIAGDTGQVIVPLNEDLVCQFTVQLVTQDLYVSRPTHYYAPETV